jgi:Spy/CpxP family protein refolding chaperone
MRRIVIIGLGVILALALVATIALAWGPRFGPGFGRSFGPGPGYGSAGPPIANLTPEQSSKIQALQQAYLKEMAPLQQELLAKGTELRSLWLAPKPDPAVVTAKQKEVLDLQSKLQEKATNLGLEIQKVLTPEQKAQLNTFGPRMRRGPGIGFASSLGYGPSPGYGPGPSFGRGLGFGFGPGRGVGPFGSW